MTADHGPASQRTGLPVRWPSASTRQVVLLGDPVDHSLSPLLHNTAFRALDLDLVYVALPVSPDDVGGVLAALGATGCIGGNVTVPHKLGVHDLCDELSPASRAVGAVNTFWWQDRRLHGDNTDVSGFRAVVDATDGDVDGESAVVLGTGGAARAAVAALGAAGCAVTVVGRRIDAADAVAGLVEGGVAVEWDDMGVATVVADARLVVNATPLGMHGEALPVAMTGALHDGQTVHDLVYVTGTTPLLASADARGAAVVDGRALLAAQAEDAFARWTGTPPPAGMFAGLLA